MNLFNPEPGENLLPYDGEVQYFGPVLEADQAQLFFEEMMQNIVWKNDEAKIFGRHIITKRKVAWYGDKDYDYTYSNMTRRALPWTSALLELKSLVESTVGVRFNSCLLNLYHNGDEGMAWHSDDEKELAKNSMIASLSLGAERKFMLKHKASGHSCSQILERGSLLVMKGETQTHWLHSIPKTKKVKSPRVNLTFRSMNDLG